VSETNTNTIIERREFPLLGPYVEPRSSTEKMLAQIWCRMLSMDCVGIRDSYEDLGGDSLLAAGIIVEIETTFKVKVPWAILAEAGTIEQLAPRIDELKNEGSSPC
jgi:acyl carrier protein